MSLRDQVAKVFGRPKPLPPREAMRTAARTPDQAKAENEKQAQLRELAEKRDQQTAEARASIAREHAAPHLRPGWAATTRTTGMIEATARKEADRLQEQGKAEIYAKTEAQLMVDADARQVREQAAELVTEPEAVLSIDTEPALPEQAAEIAPARSSGMTADERAARIAASEATAAQEAANSNDLDPGREM